jgi:ABC-type multidrug transport system ATPase subunit
MSAEDRVQVVDLARSYGNFEAVRGISVEIPAGETFGLLGPNGAGKTTTLSMLSTLLKPSRGDVRVFGASRSASTRSSTDRRTSSSSVGSTGSRAPG